MQSYNMFVENDCMADLIYVNHSTQIFSTEFWVYVVEYQAYLCIWSHRKWLRSSHDKVFDLPNVHTSKHSDDKASSVWFIFEIMTIACLLPSSFIASSHHLQIFRCTWFCWAQTVIFIIDKRSSHTAQTLIVMYSLFTSNTFPYILLTSNFAEIWTAIYYLLFQESNTPTVEEDTAKTSCN